MPVFDRLRAWQGFTKDRLLCTEKQMVFSTMQDVKKIQQKEKPPPPIGERGLHCMYDYLTRKAFNTLTAT